jgi:hypothetical protein
MTDLLDLKFGYRYMDIDYEDSDVEVNETVDGAYVGLTFNWQRYHSRQRAETTYPSVPRYLRRLHSSIRSSSSGWP